VAYRPWGSEAAGRGEHRRGDRDPEGTAYLTQWFLGRDAIGEFLATGFARGGTFRFAQTRANGQAALGVYRRRNGDAHRFLQMQVLTMTETGIAQINAFRVNGLYAQFGLPAVLEDLA
jgi:RNA polymerase sigma-70 factor (ECF subfamily)